MHGHDVLPSNADEAQAHYTYKRECDVSLLGDLFFFFGNFDCELKLL